MSISLFSPRFPISGDSASCFRSFRFTGTMRGRQRGAERGFLSDLTCDSDGKIDKFIGGEPSLPLHRLEGNSGGYYLGMFLGGAYEESLGGVHNLFGGASTVRVAQSDGAHSHSFAVKSAVPGASCGDMLRAVQYQPEIMFETLRHRAEEFVGDCGAAAAAVEGLARSFSRTPYLAADSDGTVVAAAAEEKEQ